MSRGGRNDEGINFLKKGGTNLDEGRGMNGL